jgi:hypothetical protein
MTNLELTWSNLAPHISRYVAHGKYEMELNKEFRVEIITLTFHYIDV